MKARPPVAMKPRKVEFDGATMPDFRGMRMPESIDLVVRIRKRFPVRYAVTGTGRVFAQRPAPGAALDDSTKVILEFKE